MPSDYYTRCEWDAVFGMKDTSDDYQVLLAVYTFNDTLTRFLSALSVLTGDLSALGVYDDAGRWPGEDGGRGYVRQQCCSS